MTAIGESCRRRKHHLSAVYDPYMPRCQGAMLFWRPEDVGRSTKPTAEVLQIRQPTSLKVGRVAVAQTLARCVPLRLGYIFRNIVAVRSISVKLGNGWKRLGRSERLSSPSP
jgi:hypothetical protein